MIEACEAALGPKEPNITKITREYGVPCRTLQNRVKTSTQVRTARAPVNEVLEGHQEKALIC
jgi:hypothetical protein